MSLRDRLAAIVVGMPDGAAVTLPVGWLRAELAAEGENGASADGPVADLSVAQVAAKLDRSPSTVRDWCAAGEIPGAYKLRGREWRVPPSRLREFLRGQRDGERRVVGGGRADLGAWRRQAGGER